MTGKIVARMRKLLPRHVSGPRSPKKQAGLDLREEYANAFRTESYNEFWTRVLALSDEDPSTLSRAESTTATRLPSYRLFVEHLLDPDQPTVVRILDLARIRPAHKAVLAEYFSETARASLLCSSLLKIVDRTRVRYDSLRSTLQSLGKLRFGSLDQFPNVLIRLNEFLEAGNPFVTSTSSITQVQSIQTTCSALLNRLESSRNKVRVRIRFIKKLKQGSATFLIAVTASLTLAVMAHGLALIVAAPAFMAATLEIGSTRSLGRGLAQLDAAAKGTYVLKKDVETVSRLVDRVGDELEHMRMMVRFWVERPDDKIQAGGEVALQLGKNECGFVEQLDELEEYLYLCFMNINRARNLVIKELLDPGQTP